jgi:hypothetical protein
MMKIHLLAKASLKNFVPLGLDFVKKRGQVQENNIRKNGKKSF